MRSVLFFLLLSGLAYAAEVNEKLFSENNASIEIDKIRSTILSSSSTDPEEQNKISIKRLFLNKIEALANTHIEAPIVLYDIPDTKTLSQDEFLNYFDDVALKLNKMSKHVGYKEGVRERLLSIRERLKELPPQEKDEILHAQLEYAYFKWKDILNERRIKQYETYLAIEKERYKSAFNKVKIDLESLEKQTNDHNERLQVLYQKKVYLELRLEKETIQIATRQKEKENVDLNETKLLEELEDTQKNWQYNFVAQELETIKKKISHEIELLNKILLLRQINNLKNEDLDSYILVRSMMESLSSELVASDKELFILQQKMLEWLKYEYIGDFAAMYYDFESWAERLYAQIVEIINTPLFYKDEKPVDISNILMMFMIIIIGFMIAKFYKRRVVAAQKRVTFIQKQSFKIIGNIGYYIIIIVTFAISLNSIGLDLSSLSLVAGALSVGIGFGLKEVVGNFVSGIILMAERSVKIGDFIELENGTAGNVIDIRMRSVTIKTSANIDIVVPNSDLVQHSFVNYTLEEPVRRLSIPFTVAYGVSFETVDEVIRTALEQSDLTYLRDSKEYQSEVIMTGMDERGVNYTLFVFVNTYGPNARSSFFRLIYKTLQEHNLPIPAPRLDLTMQKVVIPSH